METGDVTQLAECFSSMHETLGLIPGASSGVVVHPYNKILWKSRGKKIVSLKSSGMHSKTQSGKQFAE